MHRVLELQSGQPAPMDQCPGWPVVVMAVAQQESAQLLTGLTQAAHRRQTRTQEIADSLMGRKPAYCETVALSQANIWSRGKVRVKVGGVLPPPPDVIIFLWPELR